MPQRNGPMAERGSAWKRRGLGIAAASPTRARLTRIRCSTPRMSNTIKSVLKLYEIYYYRMQMIDLKDLMKLSHTFHHW